MLLAGQGPLLIYCLIIRSTALSSLKTRWVLCDAGFRPDKSLREAGSAAEMSQMQIALVSCLLTGSCPASHLDVHLTLLKLHALQFKVVLWDMESGR